MEKFVKQFFHHIDLIIIMLTLFAGGVGAWAVMRSDVNNAIIISTANASDIGILKQDIAAMRQEIHDVHEWVNPSNNR